LVRGAQVPKGPRAQHRFEREQALTAHGRDKVDDAISALRFLQRHTREVVEGDFALPDAAPSDLAAHYERLGQAIPYLTTTATRTDIELVHDIVGDGLFERYRGPGAARHAVWLACRLGQAGLGRYLRGEPWQSSEELAQLRSDHAEYSQLYTEEMEANAAAEQEWRKAQAGARQKKGKQVRTPEQEADSPSK